MGRRVGRDRAADREGWGGGTGGTGRRNGRDGEFFPSGGFVYFGFSGYLLSFNRRLICGKSADGSLSN